MLIGVAIVTLVPQTALWLPEVLFAPR